MTARLKLGLAVVGALVLGFLLLQALNDPASSGSGDDTHLEGDSDYLNEEGKRGSLHADAGTGQPGDGEMDPSLTADGKAPKPDSLIGARLPSGIDWSDPAVRVRELTRILGTQPIEWRQAAKIVALMTERIPDELRPAILWELSNGKRNQVMHLFSALRDPTFVEDLFDVLDDSTASRGARAAALQGLWRMPGAPADDVARRLEGRLTNDFSRDREVLFAIAARGGQEAARAMVEYVQRLKNPREIPPHILQRIDLVKDKQAANVVLQALAQESSPKVLRALIGMVGRPNATAFSETIISLDRDGQDDAVRTQALFALGRIGDEASVTYLLDKAGESGHYGERAIQSIASISSADAGARKRLADALAATGNGPNTENARVSLLLAIGAVGDKDTLPAVAATLGDRSSKVREAAVRAIGRMGPKAEAYVDELSRTYAQGETRLRVRVATALTSIGGKKALAELKGMLAEEGLNASLQRTLKMGVRTVEHRLEAERTGMR